MPKSLGDFLHDLFKKAGQDVNDAAIKDFLSNTAMTMEIPDAVAKGLDNNLLSVSDAKNNHPDIKNHYTKSALDGIDKVIEDILKDMPDEVKTEVTGERSSYKRVSLIAQKIKELESKKAGAGKGDKDVLQKQIDDLHKDLAAEKKAKDDLKKQFDGNLLKYKVESEQKTRFARYKTIYDDLDAEIKNTSISSILNKELQDKDAVLTYDDKGNFTLLKKDGSNFYGDNHQQVTPDQFIEQLLSRHKLLITTPKPGEKPPATPKQPASGGDGKDAGNPTLKSLATEARKAFEKNGAVVN